MDKIGCASLRLESKQVEKSEVRLDLKELMVFLFLLGIQNVGIAFMVLLYSFPAPENSQASVIPLIVAYLSTQPFYVILLCRWIRRQCCPVPAEKTKEIDRQTSSVIARQVNDMKDQTFDAASQTLI